MVEVKISAIVPTIGRPESLKQLLDSLATQTRKPDEVIIADGSEGTAVASLISDKHWKANNLVVRHITVFPPNAVHQRQAAIAESTGDFLLLLDDDVVLESDCVEKMCELIENQADVVAVMADFNNQNWSNPTIVWRLYLRLFHGLHDGEWQGKVIGPLLRFGYNPSPLSPVDMQWIGTCDSLVKREAFESVGGFSDFFLHRCSINEDVDLGLKLSNKGRILLCPAARLSHHHAPSGRVSVRVAAEDDIYNRFMILHKTLGYSKIKSLVLVAIYFFVEGFSNIMGSVKRLKIGSTLELIRGRLRGLVLVGRVYLRNYNKEL